MCPRALPVPYSPFPMCPLAGPTPYLPAIRLQFIMCGSSLFPFNPTSSMLPSFRTAQLLLRPQHLPSRLKPPFPFVAPLPVSWLKLLREGADVSRRDPASQQSVLDVAVSSACLTSRARIVRVLLEAKADPNGGAGSGGSSTPLHTACRADAEGGVAALEALLEGGADANVSPPCSGRRLLRPLHIAAVHGNAEAVSALTLKGCRLDVKTLDPSRCAAAVRCGSSLCVSLS